MDEQNRNLILATALSFLVILVWFLLFPPPEEPVTTAADPAAASTETVGDNANALSPDASTDGAAPGTPAAGTPEAPAAITEAARVQIDTPRLTGTLTTLGGRIDDLALKDYRVTLDEGSDLVRLFRPVGSDGAYYALHGWIAVDGAEPGAVPGDQTPWAIEGNATLTPQAPVTLVWDNGAGLVFRKTFTVDDDFLFTVTQTVENTTDNTLTLRPYGQLRRHGEPETENFFIIHEGVVRMSDGTLEEIDYADMPDLTAEDQRIEVGSDGWIGFTDKYWMSTLIPSPGTGFRSVAREVGGIYLSETVYGPTEIAPGATVSAESLLFAGAKEWATIRDYQSAGIDRFIDSIDWGWFYFLTKPIFAVLHWLNQIIGNMGWSIIALTFIIKAALLPLAYKSYVSMAKMKELQPEMEKLKERAGDNREELQKGMMELYKKNKVNPASGCLPILLQIPIFFSLYKVIAVTIELRHAPFFGPFQDLSAPDPTSIMNLFGLLPFDAPPPESLLALIFLGILPIFLGVSMWLQQKLNPSPTDPTQKMVFAWMPWIFMFMLGSFASGLVIYWIANNVITFVQQYLIMRSQGYTPDLIGNIRGGGKADPKPAAKGAPAKTPPKGGKGPGKT